MKKTNKLISILIAVAMLLSMAPISAFAASVVASGKFGASGSNLTWSLDSDGVLTISGNGEMEDFASVSKVPWYSKRTNVKTVVIESGVTNIGKDAFYGISALVNATISDTVTSIGNRAFSGSGLTNFEFSDAGNLKTIKNAAFSNTQIKNMVIPDGVTTLGSYVFGYGPIQSVTIPASVTSIGNYFFEETSSLNEVIFLGNKEPETIGDTVFLGCSSLAYVSVPADYEGDTFSNMKVAKAVASVAEVNGQGFATLADAISAAQSINGAELKLLSHISIDSGITIESGKFTIDLNGKELFSNGYFLLRIDGADVTIVDSAGGGIFNATNDQGNVVLEVLSGSANISGGTFNSAGYPATVRDGTLKLTGKDFVLNGNCRIGWYGGSIDLSACTADEVRIQACADGLQASAVTLPDGWGLFETDGTPCTEFVKNDIYVAKAGFKVTASVNPAEGGMVEGAGTYSSGATVTLTATAANGYRFINWIENGEEVSTSAVYTFTASKNRELTANFEIVPHTHSFTYSASGDTITAVCENADGNCPDPEGTLTILAPADLYVDGITAKEATIENNLVDTSVAISDITYSAPYGLPPKDAGTYTASVTVGGATAMVEFTLLNYAAMVTDKDGYELSGSPYKTFADAITAAQDNEGSTLTLLDNITLTSTQIIYSGKFTLDLNGKTLLNETGVTLQINKEANVTVKNSGEGGTVKTGGTNTPAISNLGTLTVDAGNIIGKKQAVNSSGTLTVNGGKFEAEYSLYISSGETVIEDGEFNGIVCVFASCTVNGGDFTAPRISINYEDGILTVNGGTFDIDEIRILAGTVSLAGGEFTNGFVLKSENTEDTLNSFLAEGYKFYDADGNKMTVADDATVINGYVKVKEHIVASVTVNNGGVEEVSYYKTFADAITAASASEGSTVTLLDDITLTAEQNISSGKFTLDLNGKNLINENGRVLYILEEADLTIKDSGEGGTIETKDESVDCIYNYGKLTVESGIIKGDGGIRNFGVLYFNDGTVEADNYPAIANYNDSTVYVYDGVLKGGKNSGAVENGGTLYVYGGEIESIVNVNDAYISGGKIDRDDYMALNLLGGTVEITGGSFTGTDNEYGRHSGTPYGEWTVDINEGATLILKGGEFPNGFVTDETTVNALLAEGYAFYDKDGNKITVADDATKIDGYVQVKEYFAASVTDKDGNELEGSPYKTLADAITAAQGSEGSTVTLLDDVTLKELFEINSGKITLDLNGKTISASDGIAVYADLTVFDSATGGKIYGDTFGLLNSGLLTVKGGVINASCAIYNYGTVNVIDGDIQGKITNNGKVTVNGGTLTYINNVNTSHEAVIEINDGIFTSSNTIVNSDGEIIVKGGKYPNGFSVTNDGISNCTLNTILAEDYYYKDADGKLIIVSDDTKVINGYVKVTKGADLADAVVTLDSTEFTYNGSEIKPTVIVTVGGKTLTEGKDYTLTFANNVNAGTATVTLIGAGDYKGEATKEFTIVKADNSVTAAPTPNAPTYNGEAHNLISAGEAMYGTMVYSLDGTEYSETIPQGTDAGDYIVYYKVIGDSNHNDTEPATLTVTINRKDISDGFIILGAPLTYNGKEQTQTVEKVLPSGTAPEVTYTVSGNKATNVGVYLLTVTGTGNFTGEAKIAYEIAVDKSAVEGLTIENVKSTDKENVEYVYSQLENAVKDLADEDKIAEWNTLQSYCAAMRQRIYIIENLIEAFENKLGEYDINTVTSDDAADLESFQNSVGKFNNDYYDNLTDEQEKKIIDIYSAIEDLETRISDVAEEITRITNAVNGYDEATVKYSDYKDILQLIDDIEALTDGQNITADERASLEELNTKANLLAAKIRSTADEIARITRTVNAYSIDTVKSSDKADIENLIARIKKLTDGDNITADERANLNELDSTLDALLAKIDETADELARLEAEVGKYDEATVKSSDLDALNKLDSEIYALALTDNVTAEEKTKLNELHDKVFALITKVGNVSEEIVRIVDAIDAYVFESVKSSDKADIVKLIADIKALIDGDNITTDERAVLVKADQTADALLEKIAATAEEIKRIDNATNAYDISTVTSADKADIEKLLADSKALQDGDNITEAEEAALVENDATLNALLDRIAATTNEIERIDEAVNGYDKETVTSDDVPELGKLIEDIKALTDGDNLTDDEKADLEANGEAIDELIEKLAEVAEEIKKADEAVKSYDEETVKSTDSEDLAQLKEDVQALIDSTNTTENEKTVLEEMIKDIEGLEDKIEEIEIQLERIAGIENVYNPETVTSDDKADIENAIAEIEAVNSDNLTDEQREEYEEIKAGFEALLEEIAAAEKDVADIGTELEMFDEKRVTIFWEDDIEALKAKIDELLADENMGETEKAKLNEYKAQCDNLIEIIHTPAEYFSLRLFYLIWDLILWIWNSVVNAFSGLFGIQAIA